MLSDLSVAVSFCSGWKFFFAKKLSLRPRRPQLWGDNKRYLFQCPFAYRQTTQWSAENLFSCIAKYWEHNFKVFVCFLSKIQTKAGNLLKNGSSNWPCNKKILSWPLWSLSLYDYEGQLFEKVFFTQFLFLFLLLLKWVSVPLFTLSRSSFCILVHFRSFLL